MDAKEFFIKLRKICDVQSKCSCCPIVVKAGGVCPVILSGDIDSTIAAVEIYKLEEGSND
jgi:hypothetical protein